MTQKQWQDSPSAPCPNCGHLTHEARQKRRKDIAQLAARKKPVLVAQKYKVTIRTVLAACQEFDVEPFGSIPMNPMKISTFKILALLQTTKRSLNEIAADFDLSAGRIGAILKKARAAGMQFSRSSKRKLER